MRYLIPLLVLLAGCSGTTGDTSSSTSGSGTTGTTSSSTGTHGAGTTGSGSTGGTIGGHGAIATASSGSTGCQVKTWWPDADRDGYGDSVQSVTACAAPAGYVADHTDCDDKDAHVHPGAPLSDTPSPNVTGGLHWDIDCNGVITQGPIPALATGCTWTGTACVTSAGDTQYVELDVSCGESEPLMECKGSGTACAATQAGTFTRQCK